MFSGDLPRKHMPCQIAVCVVHMHICDVMCACVRAVVQLSRHCQAAPSALPAVFGFATRYIRHQVCKVWHICVCVYELLSLD